MSSGFCNAQNSFWLKQGLEPATAGIPLNRLTSASKSGEKRRLRTLLSFFVFFLHQFLLETTDTADFKIFMKFFYFCCNGVNLDETKGFPLVMFLARKTRLIWVVVRHSATCSGDVLIPQNILFLDISSNMFETEQDGNV